MLYYRLTFTAGAEKLKFYTIKNFRIGAHITGVVRRNFDKDSELFTVTIYDEKSGKLIQDRDIISDGCMYIIIIRRDRRRVTGPSKSKRSKRYWIR